MRTNRIQKGFTLIEMVVFLVVVATASTALFKVYNYSLINQGDPLIRVRAIELAQARLDEVLALKYDESTPTGGIPACSNGSIVPGSGGGAATAATPVACTNTADANMNDVDDYNGVSDTPVTGYTRIVTVATNGNLKTITVVVSGPKSVSWTMSAIRANF